MRINFICQMLFLLALMLGVSFAINTDAFSQGVIWALFVYIIVKEFIDEYKLSKLPENEATLRRLIIEKLDKAIDQIKKIV
jgi:hypothetical protein